MKKETIIIDDPHADDDSGDFEKARERVKNWREKPNCLPLPGEKKTNEKKTN